MQKGVRWGLLKLFLRVGGYPPPSDHHCGLFFPPFGVFVFISRQCLLSKGTLSVYFYSSVVTHKILVWFTFSLKLMGGAMYSTSYVVVNLSGRSSSIDTRDAFYANWRLNVDFIILHMHNCGIVFLISHYILTINLDN